MTEPGIVLRYDSQGAQRAEDELRGIADALRTAEGAMGGLADEAQGAAAGLDGLGDEAGGAADGLDGASEAARRLAAELEALQQNAELTRLKAQSEDYRQAVLANRDAQLELKTALGLVATTAAQVDEPLDHAARTAARLAAEIESLQDRARLDIARAESREYADALRDADIAARHLAASQGRLDESTGSVNASLHTTSTTATKATGISKGLAVGGFAVAASAALDLARQAVAAAKGVAQFAQAGAEAQRVAAHFNGDIEALRKSSIGLMDDTTLQRWHNVGTEIGFTGEQVQHLTTAAAKLYAEGFGESAAKNMEALVNGEAEAMRKLGLAVDASAEKFNGLTDIQKKYAIGAEVAAGASQIQAHMIDQSNLGLDQAATQWDNFVSELQVAAFEFLKSSGMIDMFSEALAGAKQWFEDNRETIEKLAKVGFKLFQLSIERIIPLIESMEPALWLVADALEEVAYWVDRTKGFFHFMMNPLGAVIGMFGEGEEAGQDMAVAVKDVGDKAKQTAVDVRDLGKALRTVPGILGKDGIFGGDDIIGGGWGVWSSANSARELAQNIKMIASSADEAHRLLGEVEDAVIARGQHYAHTDYGAKSLELDQDRIDDAAAIIDELYAPEKTDNTKAATKAQKEYIDTLGYLRDGYVALYQVLGGEREDAGTAQWWNDMERRALTYHRAVEMVREAHEAVAAIGGGMLDVATAPLTKDGDWGTGRGEFGEIEGPIIQGTPAGQSISKADEFDAAVSDMDRFADTFSGFSDMFEASATSVEGHIQRIPDAFTSMVGELDARKDDVRAALDSISTGMGSQTKAWGTMAQTGIAAASALGQGIIKDQKTLAHFMGGMEAANALASYPDFVGMATHFAASAAYFVMADATPSGTVVGGSRGGAGRGGGGSGSTGGAAALADRFATTLPDRRRDMDTRETTIVQLQVDGRELGEAAIGGANRLHARYRNQQTLDANVTGRGARRLVPA